MRKLTNMEKLIIFKVTKDVFPNNKGGMQEALNFLTNKDNSLSSGFILAKQWVKEAIQAIRSAKGNNPWKNSTDEEIAKELLFKINQKIEENKK